MSSARHFGLKIGQLPPGPYNAITDVEGVLIGHKTLTGPGAGNGSGLATGVTAVLPHGGDLFRDKVRAAVDIINGFGKSAGLMQLAELGLIETPILLTNTFSVAPCVEALIQRAIAQNPAIGRESPTVNALVCECNDGRINDIQAMAVTRQHVFAALEAATSGPVEQGNAGAGTGMTSFGFKSGIGSASRQMQAGGNSFMLGALVLANFGRPGDLILPDGRQPAPDSLLRQEAEKGSIIVILATDMPLGDRQLQRVARRAGAGIAALGSFWGHGSGDLAIAFTTADRVADTPEAPFQTVRRLDDNQIDLVFQAAREATAEAVLNAMCAAKPATGRDGTSFPSLGDWLTAFPVTD